MAYHNGGWHWLGYLVSIPISNYATPFRFPFNVLLNILIPMLDTLPSNGKPEKLFSDLRFLGSKTPWRPPTITTLHRELVLKHFLQEQARFDHHVLGLNTTNIAHAICSTLL